MSSHQASRRPPTSERYGLHLLRTNRPARLFEDLGTWQPLGSYIPQFTSLDYLYHFSLLSTCIQHLIHCFFFFTFFSHFSLSFTIDLPWRTHKSLPLVYVYVPIHVLVSDPLAILSDFPPLFLPTIILASFPRTSPRLRTASYFLRSSPCLWSFCSPLSLPLAPSRLPVMASHGSSQAQPSVSSGDIPHSTADVHSVSTCTLPTTL